MAKITDITSDGGSNGGDPNKNPQEEDNQNDKPQEEENQNEQPQEQQVVNLPIRQQAQNLRIPEDLPNEINELILSLLERCDYPSLLCTSRAFRDIITSPGLFRTRSSLGRTERYLYALIAFPPYGFPRWHILHRRNNYLRLSLINSLPTMLFGSAVVAIGHEIYIFGGCLPPYPAVRNVSVIDCRFHTWHHLPSMRRARKHAAAGVIDGKIYVIGGCIKQGGDWVEVFDVNTQTWVTEPGQNPRDGSFDGVFGLSVVMENKIYMLNRMCCLVYEPSHHDRWGSWGFESPRRRYWHWCSCVVDDKLYSIDSSCSLGYPIVVYNPSDLVWRPVMGVRMSDLLDLVYYESRMANFGGKLVILGKYQSMYCWDYYYQQRYIGCIVIALERRENGDIWGIVESKSCTNTCFMKPLIEHCRTVTV